MTAHSETSPDHVARPAWSAPPGACDAHFHVFGSPDRYPPGTTNLRYDPPFAPLEAYRDLAAHLGLERFVFVQPSAYGRDNSCLLDAMRMVGPVTCRGIVDVADDVPDAQLADLDALGVRGVRINIPPLQAEDPDLAASLIPRIERLGARCAEIGWHLDFLTPGWLTAALIPTLRRLPTAYTVAHMGLFPAKDGARQAGFRAFLDLVRQERRCWVKLSGVYRMSTAPGFADAAPLARALIEAAPDRMIWGSDYPHLSFADHVDSVSLFNLLGQWAPDEATRRRILVDNPNALYGFPA